MWAAGQIPVVYSDQLSGAARYIYLYLITILLTIFFSDESEVSLNKDEDNGSDFAPWRASETSEPEVTADSKDFPAKKDEVPLNKAELLKSTLKANFSKTIFIAGFTGAT